MTVVLAGSDQPFSEIQLIIGIFFSCLRLGEFKVVFLVHLGERKKKKKLFEDVAQFV